MIVSFKSDEAARIFRLERSSKLPPEIQRTALRRLLALNAATNLDDLREPPSNHLEKLSGDRAGQYSIRINDQWRVCFDWRDDDAYEVEIVDYH